MKIKTIKPTNKFASIKFEEIIKDPVGKRVYTPSGFQLVLACEKIKTGPTLKIKTEAGEIICDPHHRFLVKHNIPFVYGNLARTVRFAKDLLPTDTLIGYNDRSLTFTVEPGPIEDLYDIQLPAPHWWYTSGMVSHNSLLLCNAAISSYKGEGPDGIGQNVLLITFELDTIKTAMRCLTNTTGVPASQIVTSQNHIRRVMTTMREQYKKRLLINEMAPEECSVNHIYALLDNLKRTSNFHPDVIVIDYLDLMMSRNPHYNKDDYTRQKHVSNEIRGLAKNENALVFTATQTNRSGAESNTYEKNGKHSGMVDLTKAAESFGKSFSIDYVVSINQTESDRQMKPPRIRLYIAKNRNGPKHETISCTIDYNTMAVREVL